MKTILLIFIFILLSACLNSTIINVPTDQSTIQLGIIVASIFDTVLVQPGTYVENLDFYGKQITVASLFLTTADTSYISSTIIDGNGSGSVVTFINGENSSSILCGFTITNGQGSLVWPDYDGGGITCRNSSSPRLENLIITGNSNNDYGGGIVCYNYSSPSIENVTISDNTASNGGGICCLHYSSPNLQNVTISGNIVTNSGGGFYCETSCNPNLQDVTILDNIANLYGGGFFCDSSSPNLENVNILGNATTSGDYTYGGGIFSYGNSNPSLKNVTIAGNSASGSSGANGGGIYFYQSSPSLQNVTITGNYVSGIIISGGGIYCYDSDPSLINSIVWDNLPQEIDILSGSVTATYSDIQGGWAGTGNIHADPLFVHTSDNNFHLLNNSPCIDTGDPTSTLDPDGTIVDMGAYYFDQSIGAPAITAVTDVPNDQGRSVIVTWQRSVWDQAYSSAPIVGYSLWEKYPYELDSDYIITNDINKVIDNQDTYFQREDTTWVNIAYVPAIQWEEYSAHAVTYFDSTTVGDYLSYFFVSAHTTNPLLYFFSSVMSGYSVDNIAPDETEVYITQNGSNMGITWDEVNMELSRGIHTLK